MKSIISFSLVAATLLVILFTLFLLWTPTSHKNMTATVINTPALASNKAPEPALVTESTTTEASAPIKISTTPPEVVLTSPELQTETTEIIKVVPPPPTPSQPTDLVTLLHSLSNTSREQNNLANLTFDTKLSALAKKRSEEMLDQHYFSHTSPNGCDLQCRFTSASYESFAWGENLAESTSYQMLSSRELAEMFMESWLKSSEHRNNLLSKQFTHQGIAAASKGGRIVVTVIFAAQ